MKLRCALGGHKWTESHSGEAVLTCARCGATRPAASLDPSVYTTTARTGKDPFVDQQSNLGSGPRR